MDHPKYRFINLITEAGRNFQPHGINWAVKWEQWTETTDPFLWLSKNLQTFSTSGELWTKTFPGTYTYLTYIQFLDCCCCSAFCKTDHSNLENFQGVCWLTARSYVSNSKTDFKKIFIKSIYKCSNQVADKSSFQASTSNQKCWKMLAMAVLNTSTSYCRATDFCNTLHYSAFGHQKLKPTRIVLLILSGKHRYLPSYSKNINYFWRQWEMLQQTCGTEHRILNSYI